MGVETLVSVYFTLSRIKAWQMVNVLLVQVELTTSKRGHLITICLIGAVHHGCITIAACQYN